MENLDYGVIGNCRTAALVSREGSIDWCCFPNFDSPSVFAKILDEQIGGSLSFIVDSKYSVAQQYIKDTNILVTHFTSSEGGFDVIDFMPRYKTGDHDYYFPPEIYRIIRILHGKPHFRIHYQPALNYARGKMVHETCKDYIKSFSRSYKNEVVYLYSSLGTNHIIESDEFILERDEFILVADHQKLIPIDQERAELEYQRTLVYWLNWSNRSRRYSNYQLEITRSMLVLKLMSFQFSGAVLAALTTSLPEALGEVRNWDYRFCWLRDASMSIETLLKTGHHNAAQLFMSFIRRVIRSKYDTFQIMYGIRGERVLREEILPHLAGYKNSRPVRIGNAAYVQQQNDSFGYLMDVIYQYYCYFPGTLAEVEEIWEIVKNVVHVVIRDWQEPDKGIWEIRNESKHFVFSKVMCWVTLDRAIRIARLLNQEDYTQRWSTEAARIKEDVFVKGWKDEIHSFSQAYDNLEFDSSLLLMEAYGFISADDARYKNTVKAVKQHLYQDGLMYRYTATDDFGKPTSAFTICTFWLIRALYVIGEKKEAREIFDRVIGYSNHVGLFSEDLDFKTKMQLGNFPQAYSHLALINTAMLFAEEQALSKFIRP